MAKKRGERETREWKKRTHQRVWHVSIRRDPARERRGGRACTPGQLPGIPPGRAVRMVSRRPRRPRRLRPPRRRRHRLRHHSRGWPSPPRGRSPRRSVRVPCGAAIINGQFIKNQIAPSCGRNFHRTELGEKDGERKKDREPPETLYGRLHNVIFEMKNLAYENVSRYARVFRKRS